MHSRRRADGRPLRKTESESSPPNTISTVAGAARPRLAYRLVSVLSGRGPRCCAGCRLSRGPYLTAVPARTSRLASGAGRRRIPVSHHDYRYPCPFGCGSMSDECDCAKRRPLASGIMRKLTAKPLIDQAACRREGCSDPAETNGYCCQHYDSYVLKFSPGGSGHGCVERPER